MAEQNDYLQKALDALKRGKEGFGKALGEGKADHRSAMYRGLEDKGLNKESTMFGGMTGSNRTLTMFNELMGRADKDMVERRNNMGLGMPKDRSEKIGYILGTLASDIVQDRGRSVYWLMNAPQATANVIQDSVLKRVAPGLFENHDLRDERDNPVTFKNQASARRLGALDKNGELKAGYSVRGGKIQKRNYRPGLVDTLAIPAGIAVNTSIGLMNPFGGQEGYKAVLESEDDPSKTSNVLGEVAAKYILGRTGGLLPWDEFKKVRPDVSKDEYMKYKAFKFDNKGDLDPTDGDLILPTGILKYTNEGIHGPEVQFLGRSLPLATGILPTAAAIAGTAYGAKIGHSQKVPGNPNQGRGVRGGLIGGLGSLALSSVAGNVIENERRRRNAEENFG